MRGGARRAWMVALVASGSACTYPDFTFVPEGEDDAAPFDDAGVDSGLDATTVDSGSGDTKGEDSFVADSTTTDGDAKTDSVTDSKGDTTVTVVDTGRDGSVVDSRVDAFDTSPTCQLLDDMEDGDGAILNRCGRSGFWFTFNDGTTTGTQTPVPGAAFFAAAISPARGLSTFAARTQGKGFTDWGGGMGVEFAGGGASTYDASGWSGIGFWARVGSGTATAMRMDFPDSNTDPHGGKCGSTTLGCFDHFGTSITFDTTWKYYVVKWTDLLQEGFGWPAPTGKLDAAHIYNMQVQTGAGIVFDLWIDDVSFLP